MEGELIMQIEQLKTEIEIIKTNLDCYFVGVFLLVEQKDFLRLSVGSGAVGDKLVEVGC